MLEPPLFPTEIVPPLSAKKFTAPLYAFISALSISIFPAEYIPTEPSSVTSASTFIFPPVRFAPANATTPAVPLPSVPVVAFEDPEAPDTVTLPPLAVTEEFLPATNP